MKFKPVESLISIQLIQVLRYFSCISWYIMYNTSMSNFIFLLVQ